MNSVILKVENSSGPLDNLTIGRRQKTEGKTASLTKVA